MNASIFILAAALNAGNAEFDRVAAEGAARITLDRFAAGLARDGLPHGVLARAMLADPAAHRTRAESEKVCKAIWTDAAESAFRDKADAVRKRLKLDCSFKLEMPKDAVSSLEERFEEAFGDERDAAVGEQAKTLASALRPTEAEFEEKAEDVLRREMTERVVAEQKTPVFEENRETVATSIVEPMLASGRAERKRQSDYLKRARSDAAVPSLLSQDLAAKLAANVEERRRTAKPSEAWGVFPSVAKKELPLVVEKRIVDRFSAQVENVRLEVAEAEVEAIVSADPSAHAKAKASERIFAGRYAARVLSAAMEKALSDVDGSGRDELRGYLAERVDGEIPRKAVERIVRRDVMPKWREVRAAIAKRAAEKTWPTLADGTWFPDAALADETAARSDYDEAVRRWRKMKGMESVAGAGGGKVFLEETERAVDAKVAAAFARARSAIAAQGAIVDEVHPSILADARARKASFFRRTPDLAAITEMLTLATEKEWGETRLATLWPDGKTPPNAAEQHVELFPSVRRKIELLARQILEEMSVPAEPARKPDEPQPEEKPEEPPEEKPDESSSPEKEDLDMLTLSVQRVGRDVEVKLLNGKKVISRERVPSNAGAFRGAMERLTRTLSGEVLKLE